MKVCARCGLEKPEKEFNKDAKAADGLQSWCRECKKTWQEESLGPIEYDCVVCGGRVFSTGWLCKQCYDKWVEGIVPVSKWPPWLRELVKIERRNRYIEGQESKHLAELGEYDSLESYKSINDIISYRDNPNIGRKDEVGNVYGDLTVKGYAYTNKHGQAMWECVCSCGGSVIVRGSDLRSGNTRSCGCRREKKNG